MKNGKHAENQRPQVGPAAIMDNKSIVELLADRGADATLRDRSGLLAYHYTFLTHGNNVSTDVIRDAYLRQQKK